YKDLGYAVDGQFFLFQMRRFQKLSLMTTKRRIQSFEKSQHKLQTIRRVASIQISLIGTEGLGTHYTLKHLSDDGANDIAAWYSYRKEYSIATTGIPSESPEHLEDDILEGKENIKSENLGESENIKSENPKNKTPSGNENSDR